MFMNCSYMNVACFPGCLIDYIYFFIFTQKHIDILPFHCREHHCLSEQRVQRCHAWDYLQDYVKPKCQVWKMVGGPLAVRMRLYCNSFKWPNKLVTVVITTTNKVITLLTLLVSGRGPPCRVPNFYCFPSFGGLVPECWPTYTWNRFSQGFTKWKIERNNSDGN